MNKTISHHEGATIMSFFKYRDGQSKWWWLKAIKNLVYSHWIYLVLRRNDKYPIQELILELIVMGSLHRSVKGRIVSVQQCYSLILGIKHLNDGNWM